MVFKLLSAALLVATASAWEQSEKEAVWNSLPKEFPRLGVFDMKAVTPKLFRTFLALDNAIKDPDAFEYFDKTQRELIFAVTSASNNCEICLSFHTGALLGENAVTPEDVANLAAGGLPTVESKYRNLAIAAKYAISHKGIYLEREKKHMEILGFPLDAMIEMNMLVGYMTGANYVMASLVNEGAPIEDFLKPAGPFAETVYKEGKTDM